MAVTDPFPLNIELKVDSPELTAWLAQNGRDKFANAEDINKILIALDYLRQNIGAGTGVTIEEVLEAILPLANDITNVGTNLETHENNVNNPHQTTLDQILLAGNIATNKTLFLKYNFRDENITELRHDSISMYDASFLTRMQMSKDSFLARNTASGSTKINFGSTISEAKILIRNLTGTIALLSDLTNKADLVGGLVPSWQLPAFVDDVLEFANLAAFPATGEVGKIYLAISPKNLQYRWSGSAYIAITNGLIASTNDVPEGLNLYFTSARAIAALAATLATFKTDNFLDASSSIQGQLNGKSTIIFSDGQSTVGTNTTIEQKLKSYPIPANSIPDFSVLLLNTRLFKNNSGGAQIFLRAYVNTTDNLIGAKLIGSVSASSPANQDLPLQRTITVKGSNISVMNTSVLGSTDLGLTNAVPSIIPFDRKINQWLIITGGIANGGEIQISMANLIKN